ncbi:MAG TPA: TadE/TadG family type IV pilus assembly protein [Candidatus Deferrimicrobium sp.]|nr:TadE/TadG family type IV pilus assembly protein [Candidatus Deferrimicrobium sp.]
MIEFLLAGVPLLLLMLAIVQLSLLWAGKSAVDAASHLAARKFALVAREDFRKARQMAFLEAFQVCRNRLGGTFGSAAITTLDVTKDGSQGANRADAGEALCVRLTHGVELVVPWIDRILFTFSPGQKLRLGGHYYLMLQSTRWVTVE